MIERYYYIRAKRGKRKGARVITVCLIKTEDNNFYRGQSICSPKDAVDPEYGRILANNRALRAMKPERKLLKVNRRAATSVYMDECGVSAPSVKCERVWYGDLTDYERKILGEDDHGITNKCRDNETSQESETT